jgi:hypothetical protein
MPFSLTGVVDDVMGFLPADIGRQPHHHGFRDDQREDGTTIDHCILPKARHGFPLLFLARRGGLSIDRDRTISERSGACLLPHSECRTKQQTVRTRVIP